MQQYPVGSLDQLYHEFSAAALHLEAVSDQFRWGPFLRGPEPVPPVDDPALWEAWEERYRVAEQRMLDAEIALLRALGQY